jgi:hypothetical protein
MWRGWLWRGWMWRIILDDLEVDHRIPRAIVAPIVSRCATVSACRTTKRKAERLPAISSFCDQCPDLRDMPPSTTLLLVNRARSPNMTFGIFVC